MDEDKSSVSSHTEILQLDVDQGIFYLNCRNALFF